MAIQKKSSARDEFLPYNKIKLSTICDRTIKSNEKRAGAILENFVPAYLAYPPEFSSNVRPSISQHGPIGPYDNNEIDEQDVKLLNVVVTHSLGLFVKSTVYVEFKQSAESRILIPTKDVKFVSTVKGIAPMVLVGRQLVPWKKSDF
ncbi:unnamed protein product [Rotaria socialis]|uniref:Uncharacterized protein n=1 Tax=Rotaria socialis TaxID=392032 RepID=A0A817PNE2_9BILA|nr:unnamed protein product [Rotaria socialis]